MRMITKLPKLIESMAIEAVITLIGFCIKSIHTAVIHKNVQIAD